MRVTQLLLAKGILARSLDELKRRSSIAWNLDAVKGPSGPRQLYDFQSPDSVSSCILMSDTLIGGSSQSNLDFISSPSSPSTLSSSTLTTSASTPPPTTPSSPSPSTTAPLRPPTSPTASSTSPAYSSTPPTSSTSPSSFARFYGHISTSLPRDRLAIQRTGYAAFRTPDQPPTLFGRSVWDIDPYIYLALRVKSDGRAYYVNLQTEAVEPTDLHQHRLFAKRPGQWETVFIRWNDFVRTNHGFVVEPQTELLRQKVRSVGIGLTDRVEGPFELCIERVWATNQAEEGDVVLKSGEGQLKNRKGEKIQW